MPKIDHPASDIPAQLKGLHLFHYDGAPCAQRVRFALGEKGLSRGKEVKFDSVAPDAVAAEEHAWVSRMVSLVKKDHMTPTYAKIHPNMVVPALVHDGNLYLESLDIIRYLDDAFGGPNLIPKDEALLQQTMARVEQAKKLHRSIRFVTFHWGLGKLAMLNGKEREQLAQLAKKGTDEEGLVEFYNGYSTGGIPEAVYVQHLKDLYQAFQEINEQLRDNRRFIMGDDVTIADAFWSMKVLRLIECGYPFESHHPNLLAWFTRIQERPSFQNEVMGNNKMGHRLFRVKAGIETLLGVGLKSAVNKLEPDSGSSKQS